MGKTIFEKDFEDARRQFPKLSYKWGTELKSWLVFGDLDICDTKGDYWETFEIVLVFPRSYPYCVPFVIEKSKLIPREIDWHISPEGVCCLDFDYILKLEAKKGINVSDFIIKKVYSYFANQLYKISEGNYAGGEYGHHFDGTVQYYLEELGFPNEHILVDVLKAVSFGIAVGRNNLCPCGSGRKIKHCHLISIESLKSLGKEVLKKDLQSLQIHLCNK